MNKLPRQQWDGRSLSVFAKDGKLKDEIKIQLLNGDVSGFYSWLSTRGVSMRTVEFLTGEKTLKKHEKRSFRWKLNW